MPIILHLVVFSYYIMDRKMILKSDLAELQETLTELCLRVQNDALVKHLWQDFHEVWNTLCINLYLIIFRVDIWGNNVCKL